MASTVTTNAVAGAIMNPAEASGNPVESKCKRILFWTESNSHFILSCSTLYEKYLIILMPNHTVLAIHKKFRQIEAKYRILYQILH